MSHRLIVAVSMALLIACGQERAVKTPSPAAAPAPARRLNLVDAGRGGSVVSRTAELTLEFGAALMIDGDPLTFWSTPHHNPEQTIVLSLPAPARVDQIGLVVPTMTDQAPQKVVLEGSLDGVSFTPLAKFTPGLVDSLQTRSVTPSTLRYVRISTLGTSTLSQIRELEVYGTETEPVRTAALAGSWTVNGQPAQFVTTGARTLGVIADRDGPILLDGGSDGRSYRFAWSQGPQLGRAILSTAADGRHLSGIQWHTELSPEHVGRTWYGERTGTTSPATSGTEVMREFLRRTGFFPLYGLRFDDADQLLENESDATLALVQSLIAGTANRRFTFVASELRGDAAANRRRAEQRIASLRATLERRSVDLSRVSFAAAGLEQARVKPESAISYALYNIIELRLDPAAAPTR